MTYNLDTCCITDNVANVEELGRLAVENGMVDVQESPEHLLDYSKIGEAKRENENGVFIRNCYIMRSSELEQIYNGIPIPPKPMPHAVELDLCGSSGEKDTLRLPCDVEVLREKLEKLGGTNPYSCEVTNCRCRVPIRSHEIMDIKRIYEVNELAGKLTDMNSKDLCKYKALLERRKPREIATLLALTHELNRYELQSGMNTPAHYAHAFLEQKLGVQEAQELVRCADLDRYGRILLQRDDVECTAYGLLYERGQRLQMKELETLKFYSPLVIRLDPLDEYGGMTYGDYKPIGPDFDLLSYEKAIQRSIERENRTIDPTRGLMSDFDVEDALPGVMEKVKRLFFGIEEHGGGLWGVTEAKILAPLTEDETASLLNFAEGQMADGFGKEWEHQRIETPEGDIFVSLWNPDNFQMIPEAEFAPGQSIDYDYSGGMKF